MSLSLQELLPLLAELNRDRCSELSLEEVARRTSVSPHYAQRNFRRIVGESPKQYQLRLRIEEAALRLQSTDRRVIDVALQCGFNNHETFTRAFVRHFGLTPIDYRHRGVASKSPGSDRLVTQVGPCIGLFNAQLDGKLTSNRPRPAKQITKGEPMQYDVERRTLDETPFLHMQRRVDVNEVASALAEMLPAVYGYVMEAGLQMAGPPVVRHAGQSPAFLTLDAGIPLAETPSPPPSDTGIEVGALLGGAAAVTVHTGPYETLGDAHAALDRWVVANGCASGGAPWEVYLTDPGEVPDPADWKTEVIWPLAD